MMMVRAAAETTAAAVTHEKSAEERWVALNKKYVEFLIDCALQSMTADDADRSDGEEEPCLLDHRHPHQERQTQQGLGDEGDTDNYCVDSRPTVPIDSNARIDVATAGGGGENGATGTVVAMLLGPGSTTDDDGRRSPFAAQQQQQAIHQTADKQQLQHETKVHCACGRHGEMTTAVIASTTNRDTAAASGSSSSFSAAAAARSYAGLDLEAGRCSQTCSRRQSMPDSNASDLGLPYNKCCESSSFTRCCSSLEHHSDDNKTAIDAIATVAARQRPDTCRQTYKGCRHLLCKKLRSSCHYRLFITKSERSWDNKRSTRTLSEGTDVLSCSAHKRRNLLTAKLRQQRDQWLGLLKQQRSKQPRSRISGDSSASRLKTFAALKERRLARRTSSSSSSSSSGGSRRQVTRSAHQEQSLLDLDNSAGLQRLTLSDNRTSLHHCRSIATLSTPASLDSMKEHRQKRVSGDRRSLSRSHLSKERSCKLDHSNSNYPAVLSRNQWPFDLAESPFTPRPPTSTGSGKAALSMSLPSSTNHETVSGQSWQVTSSASIFPTAVVDATCESAITDSSLPFNKNNNVIDSSDSDRQDNVLNLTCRHVDNRSRVNSDTNIKPTLRADQGQCSAVISSKSNSIQFSGSTGSSSNPSRWLQDAAGVRGNGSGSSNINQSSVLNIDPNANDKCRWMALNKSTLRLIVNDLVTSVFGVRADITSSPPSTLPDDTTSNHGDCLLDDAVLHPHQLDDITLEETARCRSAGMVLTSSSLSSDAKVRTRAMLSSVTAAGSKRHHHFHHPHNACASSRAASLKWKSTMMRRMLLEDGQMQPQLHQRHQQQQQQ